MGTLIKQKRTAKNLLKLKKRKINGADINGALLSVRPVFSWLYWKITYFVSYVTIENNWNCNPHLRTF